MNNAPTEGKAAAPVRVEDRQLDDLYRRIAAMQPGVQYPLRYQDGTTLVVTPIDRADSTVFRYTEFRDGWSYEGAVNLRYIIERMGL